MFRLLGWLFGFGVFCALGGVAVGIVYLNQVSANLPDYNTRMPAFEGVLDDDEIVAVLSFIKAQWPDDIRRRHDLLNERDANARR